VHGDARAGRLEAAVTNPLSTWILPRFAAAASLPRYA
jgi:hypothetical protein